MPGIPTIKRALCYSVLAGLLAGAWPFHTLAQQAQKPEGITITGQLLLEDGSLAIGDSVMALPVRGSAKAGIATIKARDLDTGEILNPKTMTDDEGRFTLVLESRLLPSLPGDSGDRYFTLGIYDAATATYVPLADIDGKMQLFKIEMPETDVGEVVRRLKAPAEKRSGAEGT